jgi:putative inorganic carbon (hco3(-)) transporter
VSSRGILLAMLIFPSLPFCFLRPFYGIVLWTIIAFTSIQWYTFSAYTVPWALVVAVPTIAGTFFFGKGWKSVFSFQGLMLLVIWMWFTLTAVVASETPFFHEHVTWMWYRWTFVTKVVGMTFVAMVALDSFERIRTLIIVIAGCFGIFVVKALPFLILGSGEDRVYGPEMSMIADNNDFGLALNMTLPLFFFLAQTEKNPWVKRIFWGLTVATIPAIFFTYSRGALVGLVAVIGLMFLQLKQRRFLVPLFTIAVLVAVLMAPDKWKQRMDPTRKNAMDGSAYSRINAWTYSWRLACDYPLTGGGFETFSKDLFVRYAPNPADIHGPHSIYFGVLAEHGFPGLFLYLLMMGSCIWVVQKLRTWARLCGDEVGAAYATMLGVSLVGFLMSGFFLGRQYFDYMFTVMACIIALKSVCPARWAHMKQIEEEKEDEDEGEEHLQEAAV